MAVCVKRDAYGPRNSSPASYCSDVYPALFRAAGLPFGDHWPLRQWPPNDPAAGTPNWPNHHRYRNTFTSLAQQYSINPMLAAAQHSAPRTLVQCSSSLVPICPTVSSHSVLSTQLLTDPHTYIRCSYTHIYEALHKTTQRRAPSYPRTSAQHNSPGLVFPIDGSLGAAVCGRSCSNLPESWLGAGSEKIPARRSWGGRARTDRPVLSRAAAIGVHQIRPQHDEKVPLQLSHGVTQCDTARPGWASPSELSPHGAGGSSETTRMYAGREEFQRMQKRGYYSLFFFVILFYSPFQVVGEIKVF